MNITQAQYKSIDGDSIEDEENGSYIKATIDGQEMFVPISSGNRHYAEILRQVQEGTLTIQDAD